MSLYAVIPSADTSDPIVIAMVARFRAVSPKPEAWPSSLDGVIAYWLHSWTHRLASALGDRGTTMPVQWDAACDGAVMLLATRSILNARGRNVAPGSDDGIDGNANEALDFLNNCKPGAPGKRENPTVVYADTKVTDGVRIMSDPAADSFTRRRTAPWR